jgi:hypothetical protein
METFDHFNTIAVTGSSHRFEELFAGFPMVLALHSRLSGLEKNRGMMIQTCPYCI